MYTSQVLRKYSPQSDELVWLPSVYMVCLFQGPVQYSLDLQSLLSCKGDQLFNVRSSARLWTITGLGTYPNEDLPHKTLIREMTAKKEFLLSFHILEWGMQMEQTQKGFLKEEVMALFLKLLVRMKQILRIYHFLCYR